MVSIKKFRLLFISLVFITTTFTKVYEDNAAVVSSVKYRVITPRLRHMCVPLCCVNNEHTKGMYDTQHTPTSLYIASMGTKSELGTVLMYIYSIDTVHAHLKIVIGDQQKYITFDLPISYYNQYQSNSNCD